MSTIPIVILDNGGSRQTDRKFTGRLAPWFVCAPEPDELQVQTSTSRSFVRHKELGCGPPVRDRRSREGYEFVASSYLHNGGATPWLRHRPQKADMVDRLD